jgi:long-chain acyl-CoA synthetase
LVPDPQNATSWVISGERRRSRAEIEDRAARAAEGFRQQGVRPGDAVALLLRNDFAFFEATLAAGLAGAYAVPMNWHSGPAEWDYILRDCGARALVAHVDLLETAQPVLPAGMLVLAVATPAELRGAFQLSANEQRPDGAVYWEEWSDQFAPIATPAAAETGVVIYTSGSTGRPKGVRRPPAPRSAGSARALKVYGLDLPGPARVLINGPMYHSVPNAYARLAFRAGAEIVLQPKFEPAETLALIGTHRITHMHIVPAMFARLLRTAASPEQHYDLSSLLYVVHGAAHCPPAMKAAMIGWLGPILHEYYGSTETGLLTWLDSADALRKPGSVGRALPGIELKILDADGQTLGVGEIGDVYAQSANLHQFTYIGQPEKRAEIARGDLVTAGDLGWLDQDGFLFLCDRKKDVIISGGLNIFSAEIETALLALSGVNDCAVIGLPDPTHGEIICAFVEPAAGAAITSAGLRALLAETLPPAKQPRHITLVDKLPREDSGKMFKQRLREIGTL